MKGRRKLWELEDRFHCSLVGTCLDLDELRRLGRKLGIPARTLADDYRLHVAFVRMAGEHGRSARLVNKHLDRKYRDQLRASARISEEATLRTAWREAVSHGQVAAAYWALLTHPAATEPLMQQAYGEVHMLSHLSGASTRVNLEQLHRLRRRVPELEQRLQLQQREALRASENKNRELQQLHGRLQEMKQQLRSLGERLARWETHGNTEEPDVQHRQEAARLQARLERAQAEVDKWRTLARSWHGQKEHYRRLAKQAAQERDALERQLERLLYPDCNYCENQPSCNRVFDLCDRRILFVGGRDRQCAHFRALVEKGNGHFLHHDGGLEESGHRLAALLARADAVLCPLDCISHDAVNRIKRDCKRYGKPLKLLPRASLAAFTQGLQEVVAG